VSDAVLWPRLVGAPHPGLLVFAVVASCLAVPAWAQTPAASPRAETKADTKAEADADAAAAMERARRMADNPLRRIQEASRTRARGVIITPLTAPAPEVADAGSLRRTASPGEAPAAAGAAASPVPAPAPAPALPVAAPAPAPAPLQQLRSDLASTSDSPSPAAVEPIANTALPQTVAAPAVANFAPATLARLEPLAPRLLKMVEPDVPIRVLDQIGSRREAVVEFVVKPDGSVSDINLLAPAPRVLQRFVVEALSQWRYAPLPEARTLRVQLVFSGT